MWGNAPSRALFCLAVMVGVSACHSSARVQRTTPVANLQTYRVVAVRADASPEARSWIQQLELATVAELARRCQFEGVLMSAQADGGAPDLFVDLNIQRTFRGGEGFIHNQHQATVDVLLVLSDGRQELLGSAWIRGTSPVVQVEGRSPEGEAIDAVAGKIAEMLATSGCTGPRIARAEEAPHEQPDGADSEARGQAEALNDEGKALFRAADVAGAVAKFEAAAALVPDPRYDFNLCVSYETLERYQDARAMCQRVLDGQPDSRLAEKARERLTIIAELQAE